jgi:hypothetical protein
MIGDFSLTSGQVLLVLVGQRGVSNGSDAGGGGGSFVTSSASVALIVAGGGGGASNNITNCGSNLNGVNGSITTTATAGASGGGTGGTGGNGGTLASGGSGGAGGGFSTNGGGGGNPGFAFVNNGTGGTGNNNDHGGYGGGGTGWFTGGNGGGGGGYSGGGTSGSFPYAGGGGGGSFNSGTNQNNGVATSLGDGRVIITALCNISVTALANPICQGNSAILSTNAISNYAWSNGGNTATIAVSPSVTTSYTLTATSPSNCTASAAITITVNTTPTVSAIVTSSVICLNKSVAMTATGANTYTWTGGAINGVAFTPTTTSSFTVTGTNACGTSSAAVSVTVNSLPIITASINNPTVCSGANIILNGGGSASGYTWSAGAPNNTPFAPMATSFYTVTGAGVNGCTNTAVTSVTVLITPTITPVVTPTAMCFGLTATLSATGATGYTWTPGTNLLAPTVTVSPPISTTYTLFRTNGACSSSSTVNLIIFPLPLVNASATPSQICAGTGINLLAFGAITYTWLPGGFNIASFTIFPNFSTTYTVTGSNGNCTTSVAVPIIVNPSPVISISTQTAFICQGQNATLTANGGGALTYTWQPTNSNNSSLVATPLVNTVYTLSATNASNCTTSVSQVIIVNPLPNTAITSNPAFVCAGGTAVLSLTPSPNVTYNWSTGASGSFISVNPTITTNYFVTGINNGNGCSNTSTIALSVFISTFVVNSPTAICKGNVATLTASGPATAYSWITSTGVPVGNSVSSITVSPASSTIYSVTGSNGSCSNTQSVNLIVNPIPNVIAQTAKSTICRFEVSTILASGASSYSWNTGATTPSISLTLSLTTSYTITGTDINGCAKTVTVTQFVATCIGINELNGNGQGDIKVYPNPNNGNFIVNSDQNITLNIVNAIGQVVSVIDISDENKKEVNVSNLPNGIYFITGQNQNLKVNKKIIVER